MKQKHSSFHQTTILNTWWWPYWSRHVVWCDVEKLLKWTNFKICIERRVAGKAVEPVTISNTTEGLENLLLYLLLSKYWEQRFLDYLIALFLTVMHPFNHVTHGFNHLSSWEITQCEVVMNIDLTHSTAALCQSKKLAHDLRNYRVLEVQIFKLKNK
jgi:hypothetical protein